MQSCPQLMPAGLDVTVPEPATITVSTRVVGRSSTNVAEQLRFWVIWTTPPVHPVPDHWLNRKPAAGFGVSVTVVPELNVWLQSPGHAMPGGELVTLPPCVTETSRLNVPGGACWNVFGGHDRAPFIVRTHGVVPVQSPLHEARLNPESAVGMSVIVEPDAREAVQVIRRRWRVGCS